MYVPIVSTVHSITIITPGCTQYTAITYPIYWVVENSTNTRDVYIDPGQNYSDTLQALQVTQYTGPTKATRVSKATVT